MVAGEYPPSPAQLEVLGLVVASRGKALTGAGLVVASRGRFTAKTGYVTLNRMALKGLVERRSDGKWVATEYGVRCCRAMGKL